MVAVAGIVTHWVRCRPIYKAWMMSANGTCFERATINAVGISVQGKSVCGFEDGEDGGAHPACSQCTRLTKSHGAACYAFVDVVLVVFGYILVWSRDLTMGEMAGVGLLGILGLLSVSSMLLVHKRNLC